MAVTTVNLTLYNQAGEVLTFSAMNTGDSCTPSDFANLIMALSAQVGEATTLHPGFITWEESNETKN